MNGQRVDIGLLSESFRMKQTYYITTTLPYVNADLHIGHGLELVQADVLARFARQRGAEVFFLSGTDEHGFKIVRSALAAHKNPKAFADAMSKRAQKLKKILNLSWDFFIRTTDSVNHYPGVLKLWKNLEKSGDLYKKTYRGLYCAGCEAFVTEKELVEGTCPIHKTEPELVEEENYFFRLSAYGKQIKKAIESGQMRIVPQWRANEILALIERGLEDVSFSRPKDKLEWGIGVPGDDTQVMYVWADALTNYISAIGYGRDTVSFEKWWPAQVQVLGKDVLRFHAAIWPAMLLSCGLALPETLFVHGFLTIDGQKISKSLGNVIYPADLVSQYELDSVRYYLLREVSPVDDGDFSHERFVERYNGDLANGLGNFFARIIGVAGSFGAIKNDFAMTELDVEQKIKSTKIAMEDAINTFRFNDALSVLWELISFGDVYVNQHQPWNKENTQTQNEKTLFNLITILNAVAIFVEPFLPDTSKTIQKHYSLKGKTIKTKKAKALFPRLE